MEIVESVRDKYEVFSPYLNEKTRRLWAGLKNGRKLSIVCFVTLPRTGVICGLVDKTMSLLSIGTPFSARNLATAGVFRWGHRQTKANL